MKKSALISISISSKLFAVLFVLFAFLTLSIVLTGFLNKALAQTQTVRTMTISPPAVELSLAPGGYAEGKLRIINDSNEALNFDTFMRDYIVEDNQGTPVILPPDTLSNKYSASAWLGVSPTSFVVQPNSSQELTYFVQVPASASPGGHYASVMYQPTNVISVDGTGTGVLTHIGTLFYIHVQGDIVEDADVMTFDIPGLSEYGPVNIATEIQNNGGLHIKPHGTITIKNMFGQVVDTQNLSEHNIFPEKSFLYGNEFGQRWMFGRYTAELTATYGLNDNLPLVATASFIVFPWKLATIAILVIVIIVLVVIALKRRKTKKHAEPKEETTATPAASAPESHEQL